MTELPTWVTYAVPIVAAVIAWLCKTKLPASVTTQIKLAIEAILRELEGAGTVTEAQAHAVAAEAVKRVEAVGVTVTSADASKAAKIAAEKLDPLQLF